MPLTVASSIGYDTLHQELGIVLAGSIEGRLNTIVVRFNVAASVDPDSVCRSQNCISLGMRINATGTLVVARRHMGTEHSK